MYFSNTAKAESVLMPVAIDYESVNKIHKKDKSTAEKPNAFLVSLFTVEALKKAHFQNTFTRKV